MTRFGTFPSKNSVSHNVNIAHVWYMFAVFKLSVMRRVSLDTGISKLLESSLVPYIHIYFITIKLLSVFV